MISTNCLRTTAPSAVVENSDRDQNPLYIHIIDSIFSIIDNSIISNRLKTGFYKIKRVHKHTHTYTHTHIHTYTRIPTPIYNFTRLSTDYSLYYNCENNP